MSLSYIFICVRQWLRIYLMSDDDTKYKHKSIIYKKGDKHKLHTFKCIMRIHLADFPKSDWQFIRSLWRFQKQITWKYETIVNDCKGNALNKISRIKMSSPDRNITYRPNFIALNKQIQLFGPSLQCFYNIYTCLQCQYKTISRKLWRTTVLEKYNTLPRLETKII